MGRPIKDITGNRYGRLVVLGLAGRDKSSHTKWLCQCDCGNKVVVARSSLGRDTISCGCWRTEHRGKNWLKHGDSRSRLHRIWGGMMTRCNNPNAHEYINYGGRGIKVCEEWHSYESFREWALANGFDENSTKTTCSLDRIDNNGNYEPSNCRFVSMKSQGRNRRTNRLITYNGETRCMAEWAEIAGLKYVTFQHRLYAGWSIEKAMTTPLTISR